MFEVHQLANLFYSIEPNASMSNKLFKTKNHELVLGGISPFFCIAGIWNVLIKNDIFNKIRGGVRLQQYLQAYAKLQKIRLI